MLAHAIKNLDKVIEAEEAEGYSGKEYGRSYDREDRSARRDSMGRYSRNGYSRHGGLAEQLRDLMEDAPDDRTRQEMQRLISRIDQR